MAEMSATLMAPNLGSWNNVKAYLFEKNNATSVVVVFCTI